MATTVLQIVPLESHCQASGTPRSDCLFQGSYGPQDDLHLPYIAAGPAFCSARRSVSRTSCTIHVIMFLLWVITRELSLRGRWVLGPTVGEVDTKQFFGEDIR